MTYWSRARSRVITEEKREPAALRVARLRLQHWLERLAAAGVNQDKEELRQAMKFIATYQALIDTLESGEPPA